MRDSRAKEYSGTVTEKISQHQLQASTYRHTHKHVCIHKCMCLPHIHMKMRKKIIYEIVNMLLPDFSSEETQSSRVSRLLHDRKYLSSVFVVQWSCGWLQGSGVRFLSLGVCSTLPWPSSTELPLTWCLEPVRHRFFSSQITQLNCQEIHTLPDNRRTLHMFIWLIKQLLSDFPGVPQVVKLELYPYSILFAWFDPCCFRSNNCLVCISFALSLTPS